MSRKSTAGALAAVLALSGASIAAAGDDDDHGARVIRLTARNAGLVFVENGKTGLNQGDRLVVAGDLLRGDEKVGQAGLDCVALRLEARGPTFQCTSAASLADGQITFLALFTAEPGVTSSVAAVTGGTGRYRTARGEATLTFSTAGALEGDLVIRLR